MHFIGKILNEAQIRCAQKKPDDCFQSPGLLASNEKRVRLFLDAPL